MDLADELRMVVLWWNTSLSPPINKKFKSRTPAEKDFVVEQIREMYKQFRFDLFGLGEVANGDVEYIADGIRDLNLAVANTTGKDGKLSLDTSVLYNPNALQRGEFRHLIDRYGRDVLKAGTHHLFTERRTGLELDVVTSHWPGVRSAPRFASRRGKLGEYLCGSMRKVKERRSLPHIILMGDFNDDPFAPSLSEYLMATRDRDMAKSEPAFFYNPFWRHLGEATHFLAADGESEVCGTHYFPRGDYSRWYTFDQIIFSPAFLQDKSKAVLDERFSRILATPELREKVTSKSSIFDHFPVMSAFKVRA
ncbi:endonuclease/exonuclease/phosphatase family protein [Herbaspirillum rubrisubalbicans]|uniref:endonuclease/exonuclease/phosphatase family protein n=1 Tax=Herbaspirillum rubrisubalbicans TaxID=80842 RepID=UPI0012F687DA|nr:endonuclease/exonuclease/phosphatase family protein [Herbaspirillum rubrisubalbicans]